MQNTPEAKSPECERALDVVDKSQVIGEFVDWLQKEKGIILCEWSHGSFSNTYQCTENLLAEFFDIDLAKVEEEKRDILKEIRIGHTRAAGDLKPDTPTIKL